MVVPAPRRFHGLKTNSRVGVNSDDPCVSRRAWAEEGCVASTHTGGTLRVSCRSRGIATNQPCGGPELCRIKKVRVERLPQQSHTSDLQRVHSSTWKRRSGSRATVASLLRLARGDSHTRAAAPALPPRRQPLAAPPQHGDGRRSPRASWRPPGSSMNMRMIGRPAAYSGNRAEWHGWMFVMKAFFGATDENLLAAINAAEVRAQPLGMSSLTGRTSSGARGWWHTCCHRHCAGRACRCS